MSTDVTRQYENKVFAKGQFRQFALKLAKFCNIFPLDDYVFIHRKDQDFETSTKATVDELETICEIGTTIDRLGFHYNGNIIQLGFKSYLNALNVLYVINGDVEYSKKLLFFVENTLTLEIKRLTEDISKLTYGHSQETSDPSYAKETEYVIDKNQSIRRTQINSDPSNVSPSVIPSNPTKETILDFLENVDDEGAEQLLKFIHENFQLVVTDHDRKAIDRGLKEIQHGKFKLI